MREPPGPDEPGYNESEWTGFALNVGLNLASMFGLGLSLFNALRQRFEGVSASILGDIASTIGQAVRAATGLSGPDLQLPPVLDLLPIVPASWHPGEPGERIVAGVDVRGNYGGQFEPDVQRVFVNGTEYQTIDELIEAAEELHRRAMSETDPKKAAALEEQASNLIFLAARW